MKLSNLLSPNARFWVFENNAWVKITLRPGRSLTWGKSWDNGEGVSYCGNTWAFDGATVTRSWENGGTDCDGRISRNGSDYCATANLRTVQAGGAWAGNVWNPAYCEASDRFDGIPISRPDWQEGEPARVFDAFAQAAGY